DVVLEWMEGQILEPPKKEGTPTEPPAAAPAAAAAPARMPWASGLSGKLLVLTLMFVMLAEVLIYVPSIANFRLNWLNDRLSAAFTAALVLQAAPGGEAPEAVVRQVLQSIGAQAVIVQMQRRRRLLSVTDMPPQIDLEVDMRDMTWHRAIV